MNVMVVNIGSSSIKLRLVDEDDRIGFTRDITSSGEKVDGRILGTALREAGDIDAIGHRVVHGGASFASAVQIDDAVMRKLEGFSDLAPLHQERCLEGIRVTSGMWPERQAVACFDTAFHSALPAAASTYAIPSEWRREYGIRRYGFHGLSHSYAARRGCRVAGLDPTEARVITCHLGAGASLAAVDRGICVDTTMGFTPLEGLVMATRSGSVDPGLLLWLQRSRGLSADHLAEALERRSGLLGLAGTPDMAEVLRRAADGDDSAVRAVDVYVYRLAGAIAAMSVPLSGPHLMVFTGGVGENAPEIRRRCALALRFLGLRLDEGLNAAATGDSVIAEPGSPVQIVVVTAREELEIARETRSVLAG